MRTQSDDVLAVGDTGTFKRHFSLSLSLLPPSNETIFSWREWRSLSWAHFGFCSLNKRPSGSTKREPDRNDAGDASATRCREPLKLTGTARLGRNFENRIDWRAINKRPTAYRLREWAAQCRTSSKRRALVGESGWPVYAAALDTSTGSAETNGAIDRASRLTSRRW